MSKIPSVISDCVFWWWNLKLSILNDKHHKHRQIMLNWILPFYLTDNSLFTQNWQVSLTITLYTLPIKTPITLCQYGTTEQYHNILITGMKHIQNASECLIIKFKNLGWHSFSYFSLMQCICSSSLYLLYWITNLYHRNLYFETQTGFKKIIFINLVNALFNTVWKLNSR